MRTTVYAIPLRLLRRQVEYVSHVRKMSLRDRARRAKFCCAPLMIEGVWVLMSACELCSVQTFFCFLMYNRRKMLYT